MPGSTNAHKQSYTGRCHMMSATTSQHPMVIQSMSSSHTALSTTLPDTHSIQRLSGKGWSRCLQIESQRPLSGVVSPDLVVATHKRFGGWPRARHINRFQQERPMRCHPCRTCHSAGEVYCELATLRVCCVSCCAYSSASEVHSRPATQQGLRAGGAAAL